MFENRHSYDTNSTPKKHTSLQMPLIKLEIDDGLSDNELKEVPEEDDLSNESSLGSPLKRDPNFISIVS